METFDTNHLSAVLERQGEILERIAIATERSNQILYALLSPQQKQSLGSEDVARAKQLLAKRKP